MHPFLWKVPPDLADVNADNGCSAHQRFSSHQRPGFPARRDERDVGGQHSVENDAPGLMAKGCNAHHPSTFFQHFACSESKKMAFFRPSRVGREQDVNGLLFPGLFHWTNRLTPLSVHIGEAGNGLHTPGVHPSISDKVGEPLRCTHQCIAARSRGPDTVAHAFEVQPDVEIVAVDHAHQRARPSLSEPVCEDGRRPEGVAHNNVRSPRAQLLLHPAGFASRTGSGDSGVRVVGQCQKSGHQGHRIVVHPSFRCFGHAGEG